MSNQRRTSTGVAALTLVVGLAAGLALAGLGTTRRAGTGRDAEGRSGSAAPAPAPRPSGPSAAAMSNQRRTSTAVAALTLVVGLAAGLALGGLDTAYGWWGDQEPVPVVQTPRAAPRIVPPASFEATSEVVAHESPRGIEQPVRIVIPAIDVDVPLVPVGLLDNGEMEVPDFGLAGWYALGPAPGAAGPSVIGAHVDSYEGPDVFFRLRDLQPGDEIEVHGADGDVTVFTAEHSEQELKTELPSDRIWNETADPVLRLITCGGEFDRSRRSYRSNVIVYATRSA